MRSKESGDGMRPERAVESRTVSGSFIRVLVDFCKANSLSVSDLLANCGQHESLLETPDARIPYPVFMDLCRYLAKVLDDPAIGVLVGQRMKPSFLGPYGIALISCDTVRETLVQAARYSVLAVDLGSVELEERDGEVIRHWRNPFSDSVTDGYIFDDLILSSWTVMIRQIIGVPSMAPRWVSFRHARPGDVTAYEDLFGCELRFGAASNAIASDAAHLDLRLEQGHPEIKAAMNSLCEQLLKRLQSPTEPEWLSETRRLVVESFKSGNPELADIALQLGTSSAALKARLTRSSLTFRQLVEDVRYELAQRYLQDPMLTLVDIAYLLGFSEQSAFQRAFKRSSGVTPGQHRKDIFG